jgi:predicted nucleic acid-binding protein
VTFLVDASVLSEPTKPAPDPRVVDWLRLHESELVVDPVILGEIRFGILLLAAGKKRRELERWFAFGIQRIRCLDWDAATGLRWAELLADLRRRGRAMPIKDSLIAATSLAHAIAIATRNVADFAHTGADLVNPFAHT